MTRVLRLTRVFFADTHIHTDTFTSHECPGPGQDIYRVLKSWDRMVENQPFEDKDTQRFATSYIEGLESKPWHEVDK